ncbi:hypothetical protein M0R04_12655 [Candidatus Dojkabacteria bacterium]|jgi:hypothetical protein|nr:hypothetical protein [Candidatus Dojkabacteria bacterium]
MSEILRSLQDEKLKKARESKLRWWNKNKQKLLRERKSVGVPQYLRSSR